MGLAAATALGIQIKLDDRTRRYATWRDDRLVVLPITKIIQI
jgi:hypothetical protein